ncbi:hypothetical protein P3T76_009481 [Phytophthora citrophthora]|uniref:Uncharacterized protein n=1 Tax=Phytophthora citrophthora TaxID=4793 RepID=A0AAD9GG38_9STRA|nr:hypothetical protein P3T76_009481 [Phytophthora citrophthora]
MAPKHGLWEIVHTRNDSRAHNHPPSEDARVHVCHRQRAAASIDEVGYCDSVQALVEAQTAAGVSVSSSRATISQTDPNSNVTLKGIANRRNAVRRRELSTQTSMEALIFELSG